MRKYYDTRVSDQTELLKSFSPRVLSESSYLKQLLRTKSKLVLLNGLHTISVILSTLAVASAIETNAKQRWAAKTCK